MANSSIISKTKNKIIREFIKDKNIVEAINSSSISKDTPEKLIYSHIFDYHQNPNTLNSVGTFITVEVSIPDSWGDRTFIKPIIEICIYSHEQHMRVENIPKVKKNRNDYLSELIDNKLNGSSGYGIGKIELRSNTGGAYQMDYLYRKMVFEGTDLNNSLCKDE